MFFAAIRSPRFQFALKFRDQKFAAQKFVRGFAKMFARGFAPKRAATFIPKFRKLFAQSSPQMCVWTLVTMSTQHFALTGG
jgi:hypothetical protein